MNPSRVSTNYPANDGGEWRHNQFWFDKIDVYRCSCVCWIPVDLAPSFSIQLMRMNATIKALIWGVSMAVNWRSVAEWGVNLPYQSLWTNCRTLSNLVQTNVHAHWVYGLRLHIHTSMRQWSIHLFVDTKAKRKNEARLVKQRIDFNCICIYNDYLSESEWSVCAVYCRL